ncbi:MAG: hypothetical protein HQL48_06400 [Gammaproteobacteria bacterium]|nr:hypothetical protein [Gammaproteobacteria bacterium]
MFTDEMKLRNYSLNITSQHKKGQYDFDITPRLVKGWIRQLPLGSPLEAAKLIHNALHDANRTIHPWKKRLAFLELIKGPTDQILQEFNKNLIGISFPIGKKESEIHHQLELLCTEMAAGYKVILAEYLNRYKFLQKRPEIARLIHRALYYFSVELVTAYSLYSEEKSGVWEEIHTLAIIAGTEGAAEIPVAAEPLFPSGASVIIINLYQQLLLLSAASTSRMTQKEIQRLFFALSKWGGRATLHPWGDDRSTFVIEITKDQGPIYRQRTKTECDSNHCLSFNTRDLVDKMSRIILFCEKEGNEGECKKATMGLALNTIKHVKFSWNSLPARQFQRHDIDSNSRLGIVAGLAMIHKFYSDWILRGGMVQGSGDAFDSEVISYEDTPSSADENHLKLFQEMSNSVDGLKETRVTRHPWEILNESAGGFRIISDSKISAGIRVGELLSITRNDDDFSSSLASVRWLNFHPDGRTEAGIQVISPSASAAILQSVEAGSGVSRLVRALILPEFRVLKQEPSLIIPVCGMRPGDRTVLIEEDRHREIVLGQQISSCETSERYQFRTL